MALWQKMVNTNKGDALLAKGIAGAEIQFTKIELGSGQLVPLDQTEEKMKRREAVRIPELTLT